MKITIESTTKIVELVGGPAFMPARIWEGETDTGIKVHVYITRIAADKDQDLAQFERELQSCVDPTPDVAAIPLRLII